MQNLSFLRRGLCFTAVEAWLVLASVMTTCRPPRWRWLQLHEQPRARQPAHGSCSLCTYSKVLLHVASSSDMHRATCAWAASKLPNHGLQTWRVLFHLRIHNQSLPQIPHASAAPIYLISAFLQPPSTHALLQEFANNAILSTLHVVYKETIINLQSLPNSIMQLSAQYTAFLYVRFPHLRRGQAVEVGASSEPTPPCSTFVNGDALPP